MVRFAEYGKDTFLRDLQLEKAPALTRIWTNQSGTTMSDKLAHPKKACSPTEMVEEGERERLEGRKAIEARLRQ
jgi:hypothetical protein